MFCTFKYGGLADQDEVAFAASIALQAYFEGRTITKQDMDKCIDFWRNNIAEQTAPLERKRRVCCEPNYVPWPKCIRCHKCTHQKRDIPYADEEVTDEIKEVCSDWCARVYVPNCGPIRCSPFVQVYGKYETGRLKQIEKYENFHGPVRSSTVCRAFGCRRCSGRKGCCFCTEGCKRSDRKAGDAAPPFEDHDFDDEFDASTVLMLVVGPPPANVFLRRWRWDPEKGENFLDTYPENGAASSKPRDQ
jgi:hypothetical protein